MMLASQVKRTRASFSTFGTKILPVQWKEKEKAEVFPLTVASIGYYAMQPEDMFQLSKAFDCLAVCFSVTLSLDVFIWSFFSTNNLEQDP